MPASSSRTTDSSPKLAAAEQGYRGTAIGVVYTGMDLVLTIAVSLAIALVLGYVTQRLGLSPLVGYLVAGIIVSPNTPGLVGDHAVAQQLADIGVVLLMFGVGLHFDLKELLALRRLALPGALGQSVAAAAVGAVAALYLGGSNGWLGSAVYGVAVSVASTVVLTRVLADHDELYTPAGHLAMGWSIVQDIVTVLILVLLPALSGAETGTRGSVAVSLGIAFLKIGALIGVLFVVGTRVVPWLLRQVAATRSRELFTLTILVVALGIAFASARLFGVSIALGAFLGGMVVGRTDFSLRAGSEALPLRDAFAVLFFVAVGMLFDPRAIVETPWLVAATVGIVVAGKPLISFLLVIVLGQNPRTALSAGFALGQIGEFSFILAGVANSLGVLPVRSTSALIVAAIVSIALNPILRRWIDPIVSLARRRPRLPVGRLADPPEPGREAVPPGGTPPGEADPRLRAVVVGYGPVGRTLARLLTENGITCTIIEMNLQTVHRLRAQGVTAVYGDAGQMETLRSAGVRDAGSLILSVSGLNATEEIIRMARELNPDIRVIVRSAYLRERPALLGAGADLVFSGEAEVALAMNDAILRDLGAAPDVILREREKLRADLFGEGLPPGTASGRTPERGSGGEPGAR
jgi:CPA2 family monovalent cation:H+ antiporter-2